MTAPQGFVVVGDTDWWDVGNRGPDILLDSRLRRTVGVSGIGNFDSIFNSRAIVPTATPLYAELVNESGAVGIIFGVCGASQVSSVRTQYPGFSSNSWGMRLFNSGNIYNNNAVSVSGLGGGSAGDRMALAIRDDAGTVKVQFYKVTAAGVRTTFGSEVAFSADASGFYLCVGHNTSTNYATLMVDGPDLFALPDGAQPLGAAARVADRGGYSPGATLWSSVNAAVTADAFARVVSSATNARSAGAGAGINSAQITSRRLIYCEFLNEVMPANGPFIGLAPVGFDTGSFVGATGRGWGYLCLSGGVGTLYFNSVASSAVTASGLGTRPGFVWDPLNGRIWFTRNGVPLSGDPEAGTGAHYSGVTGTLVPACSPYSGGRVRLCTHAREQQYRPAYAEAWDGADLLPEQHFSDRIKQAPRVRREVSYYPWANQRRRGAPIGALDLINADGALDVLSEYDLRDQQIIAYRVRADGSTTREFTGLADGVTHPDARTCRIAIADMTAKLAVRVASPVFALGNPYLVPSKSRIGSTIASDVAQTTRGSFDVWDQALEVDSWIRADADGLAGFERTVNPAGLQSVRGLEMFSLLTVESISNGDFSSWSGGSPVNWTVYINDRGGPAGSVVQSGSAAVITAGAIGTAGVWHAFSFEAGADYLMSITVTAASGPTQEIWLALEDTAGTPNQSVLAGRGIDPGTILLKFTPTSAWGGFRIYAEEGDSITLDLVSLEKVQASTIFQDSFEYLLVTEAGLASTEWTYTEHFGSYSPGQIGYWSDQRPSVDTVLGEVCSSLLVDTYTDASGVIQLAWLLPPDEVTSIDTEYLGELAESDFIGDITVADDYAPRLSTVAEYQRNYAKHNDGDIAGAVSATVRQYVTSDRRENTLDVSSVSAGDAGPLHPFYAFADNAPVWPRLCVNDFTDANTPNNGSTTVDNGLILLHRCYMQRRRFYAGEVDRVRAEALGLRPGGVLEVTHRRYGLASGKNLMVVSMDSDLTGDTVPVVLWG